jgi:hypothetical protein
MKFFIDELQINCKSSIELLKLTEFNYFHGRMGAGKSTIARLIDFCLGGRLAYTPALQAEFKSASIYLRVEGVAVILTRAANQNSVRAQWTKESDLFDIIVPAREPPGGHPTSSTRGRVKLLHPDAVNRRRSAPS